MISRILKTLYGSDKSVHFPLMVGVACTDEVALALCTSPCANTFSRIFQKRT